LARPNSAGRVNALESAAPLCSGTMPRTWLQADECRPGRSSVPGSRCRLRAWCDWRGDCGGCFRGARAPAPLVHDHGRFVHLFDTDFRDHEKRPRGHMARLDRGAGGACGAGVARRPAPWPGGQPSWALDAPAEHVDCAIDTGRAGRLRNRQGGGPAATLRVRPEGTAFLECGTQPETWDRFGLQKLNSRGLSPWIPVRGIQGNGGHHWV
jgi:hypothetical protein